MNTKELWAGLVLLLASAGAIEVNLRSSGALSNGKLATRGRFPFMVALYIIELESTYICGGTLIDDSTVLTSAHCVQGAKAVVVIAGALNMTDPNEEGRETAMAYKHLDQIIVHEEFSEENGRQHDIAIINLKDAIPISDKIFPIELSTDLGTDFEGVSGMSVGWGSTTDQGAYDDLQHYIELTFMPHSECNSTWDEHLTDRHFCTQTKGGRSVCDADYGGPIITVENEVPKQLGVISYSITGACAIAFPWVNTRVAEYLDWINEMSLRKIYL